MIRSKNKMSLYLITPIFTNWLHLKTFDDINHPINTGGRVNVVDIIQRISRSESLASSSSSFRQRQRRCSTLFFLFCVVRHPYNILIINNTRKTAIFLVWLNFRSCYEMLLVFTCKLCCVNVFTYFFSLSRTQIKFLAVYLIS